MSKILLTIDDDLIDFLRIDAQNERRTMSAQICVLLDLCRKQGGYSALLEKLTVSNLQSAQNQQKPATRAGRPRKPGTITIEPHQFPGCAIKLFNKRKKMSLMVKYGNYRATAGYIKEALQNGDFPRKDVQADFAEDCDSFVISDAIGETIEQVILNYTGEITMYDGWLDLSHIGTDKTDEQPEIKELTKPEQPQQIIVRQSNTLNDEAVKPDQPQQKPQPHKKETTIGQVLATDWNSVDYDEVADKFREISDNSEVQKIAARYISENYPADFAPDPNQLDACEIQTIMQEVQRHRYRE